MPLIQLSDPQKVSMDASWYELADPYHFWIQWRFRILEKLIAPHLNPAVKILEIGCGNGIVMSQIEDHCKVIPDGCDLNPQALRDMIPVSGKVFLYDIFDLNPDLVGQYDMVLILDVLEHIKDDSSFLGTAMKYLKPGGWMVAGVPAHQKLFSSYDRLMGHVRRYEEHEFRWLFHSVGLQEIKTSFWGFSMLPLLWLRKVLLSVSDDKTVITRGFKPPHPLFNRLMLYLMKAETTMFSTVPAGISLMATGRIPV